MKPDYPWAALLMPLEHACMGYAQDPQKHTERHLMEARAAFIEHLQSVFRGLKTGEGPQEDAATSPDVLSRQSPVEADTQRSSTK